MNEIIDMLRNKTIMGRFSRGEIRDFLERLGVEGFMIAKIVDEPGLGAEPFTPDPSPTSWGAMTPSAVNDAARSYMAGQPSPFSQLAGEQSVEPALVGPVLPND